MGLRNRLLLALLPAAMAFLGLLGLLAYRVSRAALLSRIQGEALQLVRAGGQDLQVLLEGSRKVAEGLSQSVESLPSLDGETIARQVPAAVEGNPQILGAAVALEPGATPLGAYAPYSFRRAGELRSISLADPGYRYWTRPWFREAFQAGAGRWGLPYRDEGEGEVAMVTFAAPLRWKGNLAGVATVDLALESLLGRLRGLPVGGTGYACIVSRQGEVVVHPRLGSLSGARLRRRGGSGIRELEALLARPGEDHAELDDPFTGRPSWFLEAPLRSAGPGGLDTGWSLLVSYPREELLGPLGGLRWRIGAGSAAVVLLMGLLVAAAAAGVTAPLTRLVAQAREYAQGRYDRQVEARGPREVRDLAAAFNALGEAIREQMEAVRLRTGERERYRQGLAIAAEIQQGVLPARFPPFPELAPALDLYGAMRPAEEVGGDFFDFVRLPGSRVALLVGDVSDKGPAAALFMAMARVVVRSMVERGFHPSEALRRANGLLLRENSSRMFVTLLLGDLDAATGRLRLACAGHPPPLRWDREGQVEVIPVRPGLPLGARPGTRYPALECVLPEGSWLLMYSDGVTEAMGPGGAFFGLERLRELLRGCGKERGAAAVADRVREAVGAFIQGEPPSDDLTLLVARRLWALEEAGPEDPPLRLDLPCATGVIPHIQDALARVAAGSGFPEAEIRRMAVAVDEVVTNAVVHGALGPQERFSVEFQTLPGKLRVEVTDPGRPFDFQGILEQGRAGASVDQPLGGLGLRLASAFMDELRYEPGGPEGNRVVMVKYGPGREHPPAAGG